MSVFGRVGSGLIFVGFFLASLVVLLCFASLLILAAGDRFVSLRTDFYVTSALGLLVMTLTLNPLVWRLLRGRAKAWMIVLGGLAGSVLLAVVAFNTGFGLYWSSGLSLEAKPYRALRSAAAKGDPDAQFSLAQKLLADPNAPAEEGVDLLKRAAETEFGNAQALLAVLNLGDPFEDRVVMKRDDPTACRLFVELMKPPFSDQDIEQSWMDYLNEESRHRGWRRANEPGEPIQCARASAEPPKDTFGWRAGDNDLIPARFDNIDDLKVETQCDVAENGALKNCRLLSEWPENRGAGEWGLASLDNNRTDTTDIYGYPMAGRSITVTLTPKG